MANPRKIPTTTILVSDLNENDLSDAFDIEQLAHPIPWSKQIFFDNQGDNYLNLKLCDKNQLIGFAICQIVLDEATLFNIAIHPDYQGQGLGKQLLEALQQQLRDKHIMTLWLEVRASNQSAIQLYEKCGFNLVTERKNYYPTVEGNRENALVMACYL